MGVSLFAANQGFLEGVEVEKVLAFEKALLEYMHEEHEDFMKEIDASGKYNDEIVENMKSAITRFKETRSW
jgi:F-type H+-transporting ATPase subunit alpha